MPPRKKKSTTANKPVLINSKISPDFLKEFAKIVDGENYKPIPVKSLTFRLPSNTGGNPVKKKRRRKKDVDSVEEMGK
jgi:hypothetical protein